jgi:RNA polymerase sigma-70 factor (ECF subfamily)
VRVTSERDRENAALAARASQGDIDAFCQLIRASHPAMYRLAWRFAGNHHDAEDLVQEVFLNAYRAIASFRGDSSFETWLRRIMVNSFLNYKRKTVRRPEISAEETEIIPATEPSAYRLALVGQILGRLDEIPPRQRLMFLMRHQEGLTSQEIAAHFGTTVGTVKKTVFRVVDLLRREFAQRENENETHIDEGHNARLPEIP